MASTHSHSNHGFLGIDAKHWTLSALVVQNAAIVLLLHHSRVMPLVNGQRFLASTAIFFAEIIKLAFATTMALYEIAAGLQKPETLTIGKLMGAFSRAVFTGDSWKLAIPSALYLVQSSFQYVAASNLDPVVFALTYQLKVVSTAIFSAIIVGQRYSFQQWLSLGMLTAGVGIVNLSAVSRAEQSAPGKSVHFPRGVDSSRNVWDSNEVLTAVASHLGKRSATYEGIHSDFEAAHPQSDVVAGLMAAVAACLLSGAASVYFERLLKVKGEHIKSVWVRNVQLTFYSIWPALFLGVFFSDGEYVAKAGFLAGYNSAVWTLIFLQAIGGVLVASTLMHAGAATKCLAIMPSTLLVLLAGVFFSSLGVDSWSILGAVSSLGGNLAFACTSSVTSAPAPSINVSQHEKSDFRSHLSVAPNASGASSLLDAGQRGVSTSRSSSPFSERRVPRSKSTEQLLKREL